MQRYVPIGASRLHFIPVVQHDPLSVEAITRSLQHLQPHVVELGMTIDAWDDILDDPGHLDEYEALVYDLLLHRWRTEPNAVWRSTMDWASKEAVSIRPALSLPSRPYPRGRKGVKGLTRMIKREGFEAPTPRHALHKLHSLYIARLPKLREVFWKTHQEMGHHLARRYANSNRRVAVLIPIPYDNVVGDLITRQANAQGGATPRRQAHQGPGQWPQ